MSYLNSSELSQAQADYVVAGLPCISEVCAHIEETRSFDTDGLFAGTAVPVPRGTYGSQLWLEQGVRMNILREMTGRVALNREWMKRWDAIFDLAYNQAQYGE